MSWQSAIIVNNCPCCGEKIRVDVKAGTIVCLKDEKPPTAPTQGPFFDKTLHPPKLTQQAHQIERERFKTALGELPLGSAGTELDEGSDLPEVEEEEDESKILTKIITTYPSKIVSDNPLAKEVSDVENQLRKEKYREELKQDQEEAQTDD